VPEREIRIMMSISTILIAVSEVIGAETAQEICLLRSTP